MGETVSLKEHVEKILAEKDKAINIALAAAKEAVAVAEANAEKWRNNANEWRDAMNDRERDFLSRKEFYTMIATAVGIFSLVVAVYKIFFGEGT